jgi:hypothetical protein
MPCERQRSRPEVVPTGKMLIFLKDSDLVASLPDGTAGLLSHTCMHPDALICSHPRSGGRWLRYLVSYYLASKHGLNFELKPDSVFAVVPDHHDEPRRGYPAFQFAGQRDLPLIAVCHQSFAWELHRGQPTVFLARNAYDVVVSAYSYLREKGQFSGTMAEFIRHPRLGLAAWIQYMNSWAPKLLTHRDAAFLSYGELDSEPANALIKLLRFVDQRPDPDLIEAAVASGQALRSSRQIRTGQEGNFWDHLQPEEIFDIQETVHRELDDTAVHLLRSIGVEVDPFPRVQAEE